ncbi:MAG TPA: TetR/AcrR family transcriptional regulator [Pilimelia sp.]|nr:TetR/AcrR family transcriptional regulator [Pilimelia sp.]
MSEDEDLPPSVAAAWGRRARPAKGPQRGLSVARIVAAAIHTAQADGLAAVSMNRVAASLGTVGMSLYRYVSGKEELVELMVDQAYGPPPPLPAGDWRAGLHAWARAQRAVLTAHPWITDVPISGPPLGPHAVAWFESGLRCLAGTALTEHEKVFSVMLVGSLVRDQAILRADLARAAARAAGAGRPVPAYGRVLRQLVDTQRFPALTAVLDAGVFDDGGDDEQWPEFDFGLERVLDGIAFLLAARRG